MVTNQNKPKIVINYGDVVRIKDAAPTEFNPGSVGDVVSLYEVSTDAYERRTGIKVGTLVIGVEMSDGSLSEIPLEYIEIVA